MLIIPHVPSEMACFIRYVQFSSLTSNRHVCSVVMGAKWINHCTHKDINYGKIAMMASLTSSNKSTQLRLFLSAISF